MGYKESLNDFINSQNWIFAKTMADIPHWYCLKSKCDDKGSWDWFVRFMDEYGVEGSFCGKKTLFHSMIRADKKSRTSHDVPLLYTNTNYTN